MKVEIFRGTNGELLRDRINAWFESVRIESTDIVEIVQSEDEQHITISIFYRV